MLNKLVLLNTEIGNIQSVANVLSFIGAPFEISSDPRDLKMADKIIFPGVGAYGVASANIQNKGWYSPLREALSQRKIPGLGICVGMQVLGDLGREFGEHKGLGVIPGVVTRISSADNDLRLPHVGWNSVDAKPKAKLFKTIPKDANFYFLHSYYFEAAEEKDVAAVVNYGKPFAAAIERENIFGVQFHPEKSQEYGIQIFKNFMEL